MSCAGKRLHGCEVIILVAPPLLQDREQEASGWHVVVVLAKDPSLVSLSSINNASLFISIALSLAIVVPLAVVVAVVHFLVLIVVVLVPTRAFASSPAATAIRIFTVF
ncbi:unnamed protein product, partial [Gongylonema pulchrum]|uniref:Uncharacterized protein n=1 Tax=Gongylonema pulchrum TaxID=637853 RepID=A0A183DGD5_9BILA